MVIRIFGYILSFGILLGLGWAGNDIKGWIEFISSTTVLGVYVSLGIGFITNEVKKLTRKTLLKWFLFVILIWIIIFTSYFYQVRPYCNESFSCGPITIGTLSIAFFVTVLPLGIVYSKVKSER